MNHKRGFTLIEIMVVVAIIALLAVLVVPSLRAMRSANARAQTFNTINAALMAASSYAIMNGVRTAARFQPNGKIFLVYRANGNAQMNVCRWNGNVRALGAVIGGNDEPFYLPVIDQEPLQIPQGYAVADARSRNDRRPFFEPFYICYNPDGTLAGSEIVRVGMVEVSLLTNPPTVRPFSVNFSGSNGANDFAWWHDIGSVPTFTYNSSSKTSWNDWLNYSEKPDNVSDPADRGLARFYNVAVDDAGLENVLNETRNGEDMDYGSDHYGGAYVDNYAPPGYPAGVTVDLRLWSNPTTQLAIFKTPENWDQMKLFSATGTEKTKQLFVDHETDGVLAENAGVQTKEGEFDRIFLNAYTGRVIRPVEE